MWLLPVFSTVSRLAARVYYRLTISGEPIPADGPVLLVANHPNSLLDPMLVAAAVRRPIRFLAKAPLFTDRAVGWLIRASGAIPVYRRVDDPSVTGQNENMFRAVIRELSAGAAVGIFPEGISHSEPALTDIKTGAARIVLGAAHQAHTPMVIIPVGIILRRKDRFRSEASVLLGKPVRWGDLAGRSPDDRATVHELTERIADALRDVTINLDAWADQPLVECAEAVWTAEHGGSDDDASRVTRLRATTDILGRMRRMPDDQWMPFVRSIATHCNRLRMLRLTPRDLKIDTGPRKNLIWAARRFYLVGLPAILIGLIGGLAFWIPYQVTGRITRAANAPSDRRSTFQLLVGIAVYTVWLVLVATIVTVTASMSAGLIVAVAMPSAGLFGLWVRERWRGAWADVRRYLVLRSRRELIDGLAKRQQKLAVDLAELYEMHT